jgi:hypothetical protein
MSLSGRPNKRGDANHHTWLRNHEAEAKQVWVTSKISYYN